MWSNTRDTVILLAGCSHRAAIKNKETVVGINVRVIGRLQGVAFDLEVDGATVVALAPADYLEALRGALEGTDTSLQTYRRHEDEIDGHVRQIARERGRRAVILTHETDAVKFQPVVPSRH